MSSPRPTQGLRTSARSPGSIQNEQNHDDSATQRSGNGVIASIDHILTTSTTKAPIQDNQPLWVSNTSATWQYVFVGKDVDCPAGAPDITTGLGVAPNTSVLMFPGKSDDDQQSIVVKTSAATVQVVILKN